MRKSAKSPKTFAGELRQLLAREDLGQLEGGDVRQQLLLALIQKAMGGDLKTFQFILNLIGENPSPPEPDPAPREDALRVELGPGVEELAQ